MLAVWNCIFPLVLSCSLLIPHAAAPDGHGYSQDVLDRVFFIIVNNLMSKCFLMMMIPPGKLFFLTVVTVPLVFSILCLPTKMAIVYERSKGD